MPESDKNPRISRLGLMRATIPNAIRPMLRPLMSAIQLVTSKYASEMSYWESRYAVEGGKLQNHWYRQIMLAMAGEPSEDFLKGRVVADFGCGPRGSLVWAVPASVRIGIDVLSDRYCERFGDELATHGMIYVRSTERFIPLPSEFVDVMITMNALDHVDDYDAMCREILRVLKPGGELIGSFNLGEPPTRTEPQTLDEARIRAGLLDHLEVISYRTARQGPEGNLYANFYSGNLEYRQGERGFLWTRARKPLR